MDDNIQISGDAKTVMQTVAMAYKVYRAAGMSEAHAFEMARGMQTDLLMSSILGEDDLTVDDL